MASKKFLPRLAYIHDLQDDEFRSPIPESNVPQEFGWFHKYRIREVFFRVWPNSCAARRVAEVFLGHFIESADSAKPAAVKPSQRGAQTRQELARV
jgi:hypothetical protein